jgi:hypothetical protein
MFSTNETGVVAMDKDYKYVLTVDQCRDVCAYFGKDFDKVQSYEISEMLDTLIEETVHMFGGSNPPID